MNYFNPAVMRAGGWLSCGEEASLSFRRRLKPLTGVRILNFNLFEAVWRNSLAVVNLLKAGADPRATDNDGKNPYAVAKPEYRDILWKAMMDKPLK